MPVAASKTTRRISHQYKPEHLTLEDWQIALRRQDGPERAFTAKNTGDHPVYSDFSVTDRASGITEKVAIRSRDIGLNYCSCRDFRTNTLGTCAHIEFIWNKLRRTRGFARIIAAGRTLSYSSIFLKYGEDRTVMLRIGSTESGALKELAKGFFDDGDVLLDASVDRIETFIGAASKLDPSFRCYSDAMDYIIERRSQRQRERLLREKYADGADSPALSGLLRTELYPYQREGVLFAVRAGRCLLADDMGLGKTIQAIGAAELLRCELGIARVLVVCPTSLKYQWQREIRRLTENAVQVVEGDPQKRRSQWRSADFFTVASYHAAIRDRTAIADAGFDLIILDESQKIKNRETVTAQVIKSLPSPYGILLTGTPLENRLEELHSLIEFVDPYHLGPLFRFLAAHQIVDAGGKVTGYRDLHRIRELLKPVMLRRTKKEVLSQLPERTDRNVFVPVTSEQMAIHDEYQEAVARLVTKWRRQKFLNEKDRQRLMMSLACMRMVSDSTFILDQATRHDTKIGELFSVLDGILAGTADKVVVFSQWERMTRLVAEELKKRCVEFVNLHGGVESVKRREILDRFRDDGNCRVFLSTDAGGIGLNLQAATTVVNIDLPWNPAVLEQRIARVHRLGQRCPVLVVNLIARGTIEERILELIGFKQSIFAGVLDDGDDTVMLNDAKFKGFMRAVETISDAAEQHAGEERAAAVDEGKTSAATMAVTHGPSEQLDALFSTGIAFLERLRNAARAGAGVGRGSASPLAAFVERDKVTGETSLRISLKNPQALDGLGKLLQGVLEAMGT